MTKSKSEMRATKVAIAHCTVVVDESATGQHQHRHGWPSPHYNITSCTHFICSLRPFLSILHTFFFFFFFFSLLLLPSSFLLSRLLSVIVCRCMGSVTPTTTQLNYSLPLRSELEMSTNRVSSFTQLCI